MVSLLIRQHRPWVTRQPNAAVADAGPVAPVGLPMAMVVARTMAQAQTVKADPVTGVLAIQPVSAWIGLGANLGEAVKQLEQALASLAQLPHTHVVKRSSFYKTAPVDSSGPDYTNGVAEIKTGLSPLDLLQQLQKIEQTAGRERPYRNAPRTLDLDLLLYGPLQLQTPELTLPHPRMMERAFVLHPLHEIAPQWVSPAQLAAVAHQAIQKMQ